MSIEGKRGYVAPAAREIPRDEAEHTIGGVDLRDEIVNATPGTEIDMSRKDRSRVFDATMELLGDGVAANLFKSVERTISARLKEKGVVSSLELSATQEEIVDKIEQAYRETLEGYGLKVPPTYKHKIAKVRGMSQFGVGGLDSVISERIYVADTMLSDEQFSMVFAHELGHRLGALTSRKTQAGGIAVEKIGPTKPVDVEWDGLLGSRNMHFPGHILLIEGVTDWVAISMLKKAGIEVAPYALSEAYLPYRQAVANLASGIGATFEEGLEIIREAHFTGHDMKLRGAINSAYAKSGGYPRFVELLNKVSGYSSALDNLIAEQKKIASIFLNSLGLNAFRLADDSNFKQLVEWLSNPTNN